MHSLSSRTRPEAEWRQVPPGRESASAGDKSGSNWVEAAPQIAASAEHRERGSFRMVRAHTACYLAATLIDCLVVPNVTALSQTTGQAGMGFDAEAQTGPDKRRVRFRFFCS